MNTLLTDDGAIEPVSALDWSRVCKGLDEQGSVLLRGILSAEECIAIASLYPEESIFCSRVIMGRHGFGWGEYNYFSYPLPPIIQGLRAALYSRLSSVANHWNEAMKIEVRYPESTPIRQRGCSTRHLACFDDILACFVWLGQR